VSDDQSRRPEEGSDGYRNGGASRSERLLDAAGPQGDPLEPAFATAAAAPSGDLALAGAYAARQLAGATRSHGGGQTGAQFTGIQDLIALEPRLGDEALRPPTFPNLRRPEVGTAFPTARLEPANLISPLQARPSVAQEALLAASAPGGEAAADDPFRPRDPLWYSLQAVEGAAQASVDTAEAAFEQNLSMEERVEFAEVEPLQHSMTAAEDNNPADFVIEDDSIFDSPMPFRDTPPPRPRSPWQAIEAFFLSRGFSQLVAACVVILFVSTLNVPWRNWFGDKVGKAQRPFAAVMDTLGQPIKDRAAFFIVDDFQGGLDHWLNREALLVNQEGLVTVSNGIALRDDTLNLESYRLDFEAKIRTKAVGWAVRAADTNNYYGFKLVESGGGSPAFNLERYAVINGITEATAGAAQIALPANLAHAADFNRISVRVRNDQITTLINGWGVDYWKDDRLERGGVGLLASKGESALVRHMSVSGNDDTWGLILYGTLETMKSVRNSFSAPIAIVLQPVPVSASHLMATHQAFLFPQRF